MIPALVGLLGCPRPSIPDELRLAEPAPIEADAGDRGETVALRERPEEPLGWLCADGGPGRRCLDVAEPRCRATLEPVWARCVDRSLSIGPEPVTEPDRGLWLRAVEGCALRGYRAQLELEGVAVEEGCELP